MENVQQLHLENWITKEELLKYPLAGISFYQ